MPNVLYRWKIWTAGRPIQHPDSSTMKPCCCNSCSMWFCIVLLISPVSLNLLMMLCTVDDEICKAFAIWRWGALFLKYSLLVTWHTTKYGDPYSEFVLCIYPILSAHTQQWTHTRSSGQPFMLRHPGSSWGFGALLKGTSVVVLKVERALYIHSPHRKFLPARDSNSQPFVYESDSLTIRPRLSPSWLAMVIANHVTDLMSINLISC